MKIFLTELFLRKTKLINVAVLPPPRVDFQGGITRKNGWVFEEPGILNGWVWTSKRILDGRVWKRKKVHKWVVFENTLLNFNFGPPNKLILQKIRLR